MGRGDAGAVASGTAVHAEGAGDVGSERHDGGGGAGGSAAAAAGSGRLTGGSGAMLEAVAGGLIYSVRYKAGQLVKYLLRTPPKKRLGHCC